MFYKLIIFGCPMNEADSERAETALKQMGCKKAEDINSADLILVLACSVRQSAIDRIYGLKHKFDLIKKRKPLITVLSGCVLEADKKKMSEFFDIIFNIKNLSELPKYLKNSEISNTKEYLAIHPNYTSKFQAYAPIMNGCNNFCSYCVVPYVRGGEISRPAKEIIGECKRLIAKGYKEITLLGQNVNSYKHKNYNFPKLLKEIDEINGEYWLRFISSHPKDFSDELIEVMAKGSHIAKYMHLPVQSGDNLILEKMNRKYTADMYKKIIKKARKAIPDLAISTDIIVGFPTETKKQFENSLKLFKEMKFDMAYIAKYSARSGTAAEKMTDSVPIKEKKKRETKLNNILKTTALKKNKKFIGKVVRVLVDNFKNGNCFGKCSWFKTVKFSGSADDVGKFINVKIISATAWGLGGKKIENKVAVVLGTTASGKTKIAVELAKRFNGEIISADSRQVYKGMDIGTGKDFDDYVIKMQSAKCKMQNLGVASPRLLNTTIPHHCIDIVLPKKQFTVAEFQKYAYRAIDDILSRGKLPIICGGTGLYITAVTAGFKFDKLRITNYELKKISQKLNKLTLSQLLEKLKKVDWETYKTIDKKNQRRVRRALEIYYETGTPKSVQQKIQKAPYEFLQIGITYPREVLDARIQKRLESRFEEGMIKEVKKLRRQGVSWKRLDEFGLEYRWISRYLRGMVTLEEMKQKLYRAIRNFSKRQMTWFKRNKDIIWENDYKKIEKSVKKFLS